MLCLASCFAEDEEPLLLAPMGIRPVPVDTTLPGELAEGTEEAFGLMLPRKLKVSARFPKSVQARGRLDLEDVSNYVRARVVAERVETGPKSVVFSKAKPKGDDDMVVDITLTIVRNETHIHVEDRRRRTTPREGEKPPANEKERWERMGLTPDGKVLPKAQL